MYIQYASRNPAGLLVVSCFPGSGWNFRMWAFGNFESATPRDTSPYPRPKTQDTKTNSPGSMTTWG